METTRTILTRARSFSAEGLASMLTARGYTMKFGEPLVFSSTLYNLGKNHLFVGGDTNADGTGYTMQPFHVGPYFGSAGVSVNNDPTSANLGQISLNLQAGAGINLNNDNRGIVISGTATGTDLLVCEYDATTHTMDTMPAAIMAAYTNDQTVICKSEGRTYYLASVDTTLNKIIFSTLDIDNYIYKIYYNLVPNSSAWTEASECNGIFTLKEILTNGTSTHSIVPTGKVSRYIIDNTDNNTDTTVQIINGQSYNCYIPNVQDLYVVGHNTVKIFTITRFSATDLYVDVEVVNTSYNLEN